MVVMSASLVMVISLQPLQSVLRQLIQLIIHRQLPMTPELVIRQVKSQQAPLPTTQLVLHKKSIMLMCRMALL